MAVARQKAQGRAKGEAASVARWLAPRMITIADLRARIADVLTTLEGPLYVTQRGEPRAVLLSSDDYHALTEQLEYLYDSLEAALGHERMLQGEKGRPLDEVLRDLSRKQGERKPPPRDGRGHD